MNIKSFYANSQKGVSLIITFFIMVIVLSVVLSISTILYSQIKAIRNVGESVISYYAADSGVERALYDNKIGSVQPSYSGSIGSATYEVATTVNGSDLNIVSTGSYGGASRVLNKTVSVGSLISTPTSISSFSVSNLPVVCDNITICNCPAGTIIGTAGVGDCNEATIGETQSIFYATLKDSSGNLLPDGETVTFKDTTDNVTMGSAQTNSGVAVLNYIFPLSATRYVQHSVTAIFSGDPVYSSSSAVLGQIVYVSD